MGPRLSGLTAWSSFQGTVASARTAARTRLERTALGYCRECRKKVVMPNPRQITFKNGRSEVREMCPKCGTRVFLIGGA